ncbi:hypothetical protein Nmel_002271 [Mimus melanotis]
MLLEIWSWFFLLICINTLSSISVLCNSLCIVWILTYISLIHKKENEKLCNMLDWLSSVFSREVK